MKGDDKNTIAHEFAHAGFDNPELKERLGSLSNDEQHELIHEIEDRRLGRPEFSPELSPLLERAERLAKEVYEEEQEKRISAAEQEMYPSLLELLFGPNK